MIVKSLSILPESQTFNRGAKLVLSDHLAFLKFLTLSTVFSKIERYGGIVNQMGHAYVDNIGPPSQNESVWMGRFTLVACETRFSIKMKVGALPIGLSGAEYVSS
jgi:hypothetical protein